jgi:hypothetical protein
MVPIDLEGAMDTKLPETILKFMLFELIPSSFFNGFEATNLK